MLPAVETVYAGLASAISVYEKVVINCYDPDLQQRIKKILAPTADPANLLFANVVSNDTWVRDYGPLTVTDGNGELRLLNFSFNGWGGKFAAGLDNAVSQTLYEQGVFGQVAMESIDLVLEGGSIETNGSKTLLTTEQCLLSPGRNPKLKKSDITQVLKTLFGQENILWLRHGHLEGDDTDAHIDTLARFVDSQTLAHCSCDDEHDSHYVSLKLMVEELQALDTEQGRPFNLVPLPVPTAIFHQGRRLPATYANFLIINGAVLVPLYGDKTDAIAMEHLGSVFPNREIIGINCLPLIQQNGSLHCITMQLPEGIVN